MDSVKYTLSSFILVSLRFIKRRYSHSRGLIFLIFLFACFIRFLGIYPGFPANHPDEPTIYGSVHQFITQGKYAPILYSYGGLLHILYSVIIVILLLPFVFFVFLFSHLDVVVDRGFVGFYEAFVYSLKAPHQYLYWTRYITALLGSLTVIPIYLIGKKLYNEKVGLIAALLTAVNYRHVLSSVLVLADAPASFFASLSVLLSINLIKSNSLRSYILTGLGLGLAFSVKYFIYVLPLFLLCHLLSVLGGRGGVYKKILLFFGKKLLSSLIIAVITFIVLNPFIVFDFSEFHKEYLYDSQRFGVTAPFSTLMNYDYHRSLVGSYYLVRYAIGDLLTIAIILGFAYSLIRNFKSTLILGSIIFPVLIMFLMIAAPSSARYYTPVIPFLLLFPAFFVFDLTRFIKFRILRRAVLIVVLLCLVWPSLKNSFLTSLYFSRPLNQTLASEWLTHNLPAGSRVAVSAVNLPLTQNIQEIDISPVGSTRLLSIGELQEAGAGWVVVSSLYTSLVNSQRWIDSGLVQEAFFNDDLFWDIIENSHTSLVLNEIGSYRIKEFVKPFWQSPDRAIFIAKLPEVVEHRDKNLVSRFDFQSTEGDYIKIWPGIKFPEKLNHDVESGNFSIDTAGCKNETQIVSSYFSVEGKKWYSLIGSVRRTANPIYKSYRDGFFRLDFYESDKKKMKTIVSGLLDPEAEWDNLTAEGSAPEKAKYATVSFQLDNCFPQEKYFIEYVEIYSSDSIPLNMNKYPFYNKDIPKNFLWLPEL